MTEIAIGRIHYVAACIDAHADKFPIPEHMVKHAEFLRETARQIDDLKHKLWMVAAHATGGNLGRLPKEEVCGMTANQISVLITESRNKVYKAGQELGKEQQITEVWDLEIDRDMTTRSSAVSVGLFATKKAAENYRDKQNLKSWEWSSIDKREVLTDKD